MEDNAEFHRRACELVADLELALNPVRLTHFEEYQIVRFLLIQALEVIDEGFYESPDPSLFEDASNNCLIAVRHLRDMSKRWNGPEQVERRKAS